MLKHVFWDFDGTLFNTYPAMALTYLEVLQEHFATTYDYEQIFKWTRVGLNFCAARLGEVLNLDADDIKDAFEEEYLKGTAIEELPYPGAGEVCEHIINLGGENFIVTHRGSCTLLKLLKKYGMEGLFRELVTSDNGFPKKPNPASFEYLINKYCLGKEEIIAVGDRDIDIEAAAAAGVKSCFFSLEGRGHPAADYNINNLLQLKDIIYNR